MSVQSNASLISGDSKQAEQFRNSANMILDTFHTLSLEKHSVSADEIVQYLHTTYGDVWNVGMLLSKAVDTLRRSSLLGFLEKHGDHYKMIDNRASVRGRLLIGQRRFYRRQHQHQHQQRMRTRTRLHRTQRPRRRRIQPRRHRRYH